MAGDHYAKNRYRCAAVLSFDEKLDETPYLSAKEVGELADRVVAMARQYGIPVVERPQLARSLLCLDEGSSIPSELFRAVAILFHEVEKLLRDL